MALLHQFRIENGSVTYRSKFLQSDTYKANSAQNRIVISEFGTLALPDPCKNIFERFMSKFEMTGKQLSTCPEFLVIMIIISIIDDHYFNY